jgi:hypothetical protein
MSDILRKIRQRGHWDVLIGPTEFVKERMPSLGKCTEAVRDGAVKLRGWDYPHYDTSREPTRHGDCVEQAFEWQDRIEFWRYYQSGQFIHYFAMWEDWQEQRASWVPLEGKPGEIFHITWAAFRFAEIYTFASRLALKGLLGTTCKISIALHKTEGRALTWADPSRNLGDCRSAEPSVSHDESFPTEALIATSAELALKHAVRIFQKGFNWDDVPWKLLQEDQRGLLEKRE